MITHQGDIEAWNFKKIFTDQKVMDFTNWRFPSLSSCEYQPLKWISAQSWSGLLQNQPWASIPDVVAFQKARNQQNWSKKNQDAINFQKPAKPTSIRESLQPIRLGSIQSYLRKPGDHLNHSEDIQDILSCTRSRGSGGFSFTSTCLIWSLWQWLSNSYFLNKLCTTSSHIKPSRRFLVSSHIHSNRPGSRGIKFLIYGQANLIPTAIFFYWRLNFIFKLFSFLVLFLTVWSCLESPRRAYIISSRPSL